jgi:hypothetical protein
MPAGAAAGTRRRWHPRWGAPTAASAAPLALRSGKEEGERKVRRTRDRRRHAGEERDRKKKWWAHHLLEIEASVRAVRALPTFGRFQRPVVCGLGNKFYLYI